MDWISSPEAWIALGTLTVLEIVLGIDNIVFITILSDRLPPGERNRARQIGLALAMISRIALLLSIAWVMGLTAPLFTVAEQEFSGRDLILIGGGVFLLFKATREIHDKLEGEEEEERERRWGRSFAGVLTQIVLLDLVFSLDSVITAVGMAEDLMVMVLAIVIAVAVMMVSARTVGDFVGHHPTVKMLALSFLLLIGMTLVMEGLGQHVSKGYIYFAMGFSVLVEALNLWMAKKTTKPVRLKGPLGRGTGDADAGPAVG